MTDLLDKVMAHNTRKYRGALLVFNKGKWHFGKFSHEDIWQVYAEVDKAINALTESLNRNLHE